ncbi:hypothetical protein KC992_00260 [Candidatus Saccharibacteria bacterium]|nr:hypothetical protein [Candidatus Saccharibacteria bacterium]
MTAMNYQNALGSITEQEINWDGYYGTDSTGETFGFFAMFPELSDYGFSARVEIKRLGQVVSTQTVHYTLACSPY